MFCQKCGYEIPAGDMFCEKCGANIAVDKPKSKAQQNEEARKSFFKKFLASLAENIILYIIIIVVIIAIAIPTFKAKFGDDFVSPVAVFSDTISGKYGSYNESSDRYQWTIDFEKDGTCLVCYREYEYYSATYKKSDDGTYIINIPDYQATWVAEWSGNDLLISGFSLFVNGTLFEKI